ncbi:hypothetical protein NL676_002120 [Syzygium grande]|nr:hypothetical protein NL676_002120 [Syzygium grande]
MAASWRRLRNSSWSSGGAAIGGSMTLAAVGSRRSTGSELGRAGDSKHDVRELRPLLRFCEGRAVAELNLSIRAGKFLIEEREEEREGFFFRSWRMAPILQSSTLGREIPNEASEGRGSPGRGDGDEQAKESGGFE